MGMMERMIDPGQHLQRLSRSIRFYTDQHGRQFSAMAENQNQQPVEDLRPVGFTVPWLPPMRYAKWAKSGDLHFRWDYERMTDDLTALTAAYYEEATTFAIEHGFPVPEIGGVVDRRVMAVKGHPPMSPEIPLAAQAGHPWLLGRAEAEKDTDLAALLRQGIANTGGDAKAAIQARVDARMAALAPMASDAEDPILAAPSAVVTYQQFVSEARKTGMSMADIALAWKAHKDNLAVAA